ncbi:hypothetical protein [Flavobacterium sp. AG291]|uniref:hypothetical protein n=1 Tax=Flavobacterium sp. AG291 TaxID=2184000 RepID=UPI000E0A4182|nr:hypothetical protein [Flavobacterium sp. AG291]RDI14505.1 hypothetical protein DEU42_102202 [Flavobacterium sp. AG291]
MTNVIQRIEKGKDTVYHELGHLLGYCLSNKFNITDLGEVELIQIGLNINSVNPKKHFYNIKNFFDQRNEIFENTSNIDRTLAWFIEVVSGCTFQIIYENTNFKNCFGAEDYKIESIDFNNLNVIRNISFFKWTFDDIYSLQSDYQNLIERFNIVPLLQPLVEKLIENIKNSADNQLLIKGDELKYIIIEINSFLTEEFINEYFELIKKYKSKFDISNI